MNYASFALIYLLIHERERAVSREMAISRLRRDLPDAAQIRHRGPDGRRSPRLFGLGRLTRRPATGGA